MSDSGRPFDFGSSGGTPAPGSPPSFGPGAPNNPAPNGPQGGFGSDGFGQGGFGQGGFGQGGFGQGGQAVEAPQQGGFGNFGGNAQADGVNYGGPGGFSDSAQGPSSAPAIWLYASLAVSVIALVVALVFGATPALAIVAWVLAGPVAIALVAVFTLQDNRARTAALYSVNPAMTWIYRGAIALSLIAVIVSALKIADWVGHI